MEELKVTFYLKKNEERADGTVPILGRIRIGKSMVQFSTKMYVIPTLWNVKSGRAVGKSKPATATNKVFPMPSNSTCNKKLKAIAELCGIKAHLTYHVARHSAATTVLLSNGVPIETVSKLLGHTNIKTTQIYAKITAQKISQDMETLSHKLEDMEKNICRPI